jgi:integrase
VAILCRRGKKDPDRIAKLPKDDVEDAIQSYLDDLKRKNRSIRYVNTSLAQLETFFRVNGYKKGRELELERYHQPSRYRKKPECIPTNEEAWAMVENAGSPKNRAMIACLYTSGLRNSTLRALLYGDVKKELEAGLETIAVPVYPDMKKVVPDACKGSVSYYSFFHPYATKILRTYVAETERKIGKFADDMPLFIGERIDGRFTHLKIRTVQVAVKEAARKAGVERWRDVYPHCLRKAFQSVLASQYIDGGRMDPKVQEFLMGHILPGSQDPYFDRTKVEQIRSEYNRLAFRKISEDRKEDVKLELKKQLLLVAGFKEGEIEKLDLSSTSDDDFQKLVREKLLGQLVNNGNRQRVVGLEEIPKVLKEGWEFISALGPDRAVVRLPS